MTTREVASFLGLAAVRVAGYTSRPMMQKITACVCSLSVLSACAGIPLAPAYPLDDPGFSEPQPVLLPGVPNDQPEGLRLYPGDVLSVEIVSTQTQTIAGLVVDGLGMIHLPLMGDVTIGGRSLLEAEETIKTEAQRFDRFAQVQVALTSPAGHRVIVLGAVNQPGAVILPPAGRLADVIALVGGPRGASGELVVDWDASRVMRGTTALPVHLGKAIAGDPLHNVFLRPGDHVYVAYAATSIVSVLGAVGGPRVFPFHDGLRLTEALALAGGIPPDGDKADVRVIRGPLSAPRVYTASVRAIVAGETHDVALHPGDVVYVTEHWLGDVGEVVTLVAPFLSIGLSGAAFYLSVRNSR